MAHGREIKVSLQGTIYNQSVSDIIELIRWIIKLSQALTP